MFAFRNFFLRRLLKGMGVLDLYNEVSESDWEQDVKAKIRVDLETLLTKINRNNPFFKSKFDQFLTEVAGESDAVFFEAYSKLPYYSKTDYATAGLDVMDEQYPSQRESIEIDFEGGPFSVLRRFFSKDFLLPMATGGSTTLPLDVLMNKRHAFSMLFTFLKCWRRMGWDLGDKILVFYPRNTYNIDEMSRFNKLSFLSGFRIELFDSLDEPTVRTLVDTINSFKPKMFLVFPSPMNMIAHAIRKYDLPLKHHPELINVSGETFFDCQRANIERVFTGSTVEDSYGSVELGEIAHETDGGLSVFNNVAYIENRDTDGGKPEMIITRLDLDDFPFIRYQMRDIADVDFRAGADQEEFLVSNIEGKDTNYLLSHDSERLHPSFFNQFVNHLNQQFENEILEIKVHERGQKLLEVLFITETPQRQVEIKDAAHEFLQEKIGPEMEYDIAFVDFIEHDYRRKYRVIERLGDIEYAGGIVGNQVKLDSIETATKDA